jgi:hypothetical protein
MARYRVVITMQVSAPASVAAARLRALRDAEAKDVAPDMLRVVVDRHGRDARCAARRAFDDINQLLFDMRMLRPPVWSARQLGLLGLRRRSSGRLSPGDDDDGLGGVREPRRPIPPTFSASLALDLPAD